MKCSAYIATSADGFIATLDGGVDWLQSCGNAEADMGANPDMGFQAYMDSVDCMIMGRKCMEKIASFNLSPEQWPYGDTRIIVLSNTLKQAPDSLKDKMEMYAGSLSVLIQQLASEGYQHAYIDGGTTIQAFIREQLLDAITVTRAPILLGEGIALFGKLDSNVKLSNAQSTAYPNNFVQTYYELSYS